MITPASHLPVIDEKNNIKGLFSKEKVLMEMADLASSGVEYEQIPEHFLDFHINENVILFFQNHDKIPVLNYLGQLIDYWEKPRFLAEVSTLAKEEKTEKKETTGKKEVKEFESKNTVYKYMELILENFPDCLFTTDVEGETTFFNERFEEFVLHNRIFKNSFVHAEKYFKELNRNLFSNYLKTNELDESSAEKMQVPILQSYVKELDFIIRIVTLKNKGKIVGFLYHLIEPNNRLALMSEEGYSFPSIEEAFHMNLPLEVVLKEVETHFIYYSLKSNQENISHSAKLLGVPRSTLQNRIKQLNINELFYKRNKENSSQLKEDDKKADIKTEEDTIKEVSRGKKTTKKKIAKKTTNATSESDKNKKTTTKKNVVISKKKTRKKK